MNFISIQFNKKLYKLKAIKEAVTEFKDWGSFSMDKIKEHYTVKITDFNNIEPETLKNEFCNYVLFLMKK